MDKSVFFKKMFTSYIKSYFWISFLVFIVVSSNLFLDIILFDFVHGNPSRSFSNSILTLFMSPFLGLIAFVGSIIVLFFPQIFEIFIIYIFSFIFASRARYAPLIFLPFTIVLTWYCYDYLTPSGNLGINEGADYEPYKHGLTSERYIATAPIQIAVTLFNFFYYGAVLCQRSKSKMIYLALFLALSIGGVHGYNRYLGQIQFHKIKYSNVHKIDEK